MRVREQAPSNAVQVPCWPKYKATKDGRVFGHKGELKQRLNTRGYPSVVLQDNKRAGGRIWYAKVSQVVAATFIGPANGMMVRHLDDNKLNSHIDNLAYGNGVDNANDARKNGKLMMGERHGMSKYTVDQIKKVKELHLLGMATGQISKMTGVHQCTIWQVTNGFHWRSVT